MFFGATVLGEVLNICPYSSMGWILNIEWLVATQKHGIMTIC